MFENAWRKVERAKHHIADLQRTFDAFAKSNPQEFVTENDTQQGILSIEVCFREPVPDTLALILGDAVHNLRTALDHAMWELMGLDGGTQDRSTAWPFSKNRMDYEAACRGIKTPMDDTKKFFIVLAAYPGGAGEKLYGLHRLDNVEKHKTLTPVVGIAHIERLELIDPYGGTHGSLENCGIIVRGNRRARILETGPGFHGYSIQLKQNADAPVGIFFDEVELFDGLPLVETLMDLAKAIDDTLIQLSAMIARRK